MAQYLERNLFDQEPTSAKTFELSVAMKQLSKTKLFLEKSTNNDGYEMLVDALEIAKDLQIPSMFEWDSTTETFEEKKIVILFSYNDRKRLKIEKWLNTRFRTEIKGLLLFCNP